MREEVKVVTLNASEQTVVLESLVDRHNKQTKEGQSTAVTGEIIQDIFDAPTKKRKVKERRDAR